MGIEEIEIAKQKGYSINGREKMIFCSVCLPHIMLGVECGWAPVGVPDPRIPMDFNLTFS
jgi:hypothetical protein